MLQDPLDIYIFTFLLGTTWETLLSFPVFCFAKGFPNEEREANFYIYIYVLVTVKSWSELYCIAF